MTKFLPVALFAAFLAACQVPTPIELPNGSRAQGTVVAVSLTQDGIPTKLGALVLTKSKLGRQALVEFSQLHGKDFDLTGGYVAHYAGAGSQATLWVAQARDAPNADELIKQMAEKIGRSNPVFTNLQALDIGGRSIFQVSGMGQEHFFYRVGDKLVWVAVDTAHASAVLHSLWSAVK